MGFQATQIQQVDFDGNASSLSGFPITTISLLLHELHYRATADRRNIHPYSNTITPTNPINPSQGAAPKSAETSAKGASVERPTIRPALITPHKLSPTIRPDATSVPSRSKRVPDSVTGEYVCRTSTKVPHPPLRQTLPTLADRFRCLPPMVECVVSSSRRAGHRAK